MAQITYTNKETLNSQPSIADKNKVKAEDMNEIKSVVNTNYGEVGNITNLKTTDKTSVVNAINELKDGEIYSTSEVKTSKVWIDGKPIYRKVLTGSTPSSSVTSWTTLATIPNLDVAINIYGALEGTSKNFVPRYESNSFYFILSAENADIKYKEVGYNSRNYHIVVEYTKSS